MSGREVHKKYQQKKQQRKQTKSISSFVTIWCFSSNNHCYKHPHTSLFYRLCQISFPLSALFFLSVINFLDVHIHCLSISSPKYTDGFRQSKPSHFWHKRRDSTKRFQKKLQIHRYLVPHLQQNWSLLSHAFTQEKDGKGANNGADESSPADAQPLLRTHDRTPCQLRKEKRYGPVRRKKKS